MKVPHLSGSSTRHAVFHPSGELLFIPNDRPRTQLDLLWEGPVLDAVIDEGLAHPRDLKDLKEEHARENTDQAKTNTKHFLRNNGQNDIKSTYNNKTWQAEATFEQSTIVRGA